MYIYMYTYKYVYIYIYIYIETGPLSVTASKRVQHIALYPKVAPQNQVHFLFALWLAGWNPEFTQLGHLAHCSMLKLSGDKSFQDLTKTSNTFNTLKNQRHQWSETNGFTFHCFAFPCLSIVMPVPPRPTGEIRKQLLIQVGSAENHGSPQQKL